MLKNKKIILFTFLVIALIIALYIMSKFKNITKDLPTNGNYSKRKKSDITEIVVHHSAGSSSATPQDFARWHINDHGWPGIGYHYYIGADGKILQTNELDTVSYHAGNYANLHGIGIVLPGNFDIEQPTQKQLKSLDSLIKILRLRFGKLKVVGHRDEQSTSCPGENLYNYLQKYAQ